MIQLCMYIVLVTWLIELTQLLLDDTMPYIACPLSIMDS